MYKADAFVKFKEQQVYKHQADQTLCFHSWFLNEVTKQVKCVKYVNMNSKKRAINQCLTLPTGTHWLQCIVKGSRI